MLMLLQAAGETVPQTVGGLAIIYLATHLSTITKQLASAQRARRVTNDKLESIRLGLIGLARATNHPEVVDEMARREEALRSR